MSDSVAEAGLAAGGTSTYAAAVRHSARVRFLKKAIPFGSALAIALVLAVGIFDPFHRLQGLTLGPVNLSGTRITMELPKLSGFRKDARPYEVTAASASQDVKHPTIVELNDIKARVALEGTNAARLEAASGVYDTQNEKLVLKTNVRVRTDAGYDAALESAEIDFKAGTVVSREPVRVTLSEGTIVADTLDLSDNGRHVVLRGRVRTLINGTAQGAPPDGALAAAPPE